MSIAKTFHVTLASIWYMHCCCFSRRALVSLEWHQNPRPSLVCTMARLRARRIDLESLSDRSSKSTKTFALKATNQDDNSEWLAPICIACNVHLMWSPFVFSKVCPSELKLRCRWLAVITEQPCFLKLMWSLITSVKKGVGMMCDCCQNWLKIAAKWDVMMMMGTCSLPIRDYNGYSLTDSEMLS